MPRQYETAIPGLNRLLRDLKHLPDDYTKELRDASQDIANRWMVPAWKVAAMSVGGEWGKLLSDSVRSKRDRIPAVVIGYTGRAWKLEGGAGPNEIRWPTHSGDKGSKLWKNQTKNSGRRGSFAPFVRTGWLDKARPMYAGPAMREWGDAVSRVCRDFNQGPDY